MRFGLILVATLFAGVASAQGAAIVNLNGSWAFRFEEGKSIGAGEGLALTIQLNDTVVAVL